jgi:hypothetical protein
VHGVWTAADQGLTAWTETPGMPAASSLLATGVLYGRRVHVPTARSVTNVLVNVTTQGSSRSSQARRYLTGIHFA